MKKLLIVALALVASLGVVSSAAAKSRDRNHDRLPDRWERAHHLSLKVKQAKRDQDRDGLNDRGEFRARTSPRDDDDSGPGGGDDDNSGPGSRDDDNSGPGNAEDDHGEDEDGDDVHEQGDDDDDRCGTDALRPGTRVHEAELEVTSQGRRWEELELTAS